MKSNLNCEKGKELKNAISGVFHSLCKRQVLLLSLALATALPGSGQENEYKPVRTPQDIKVNRALPKNILSPDEAMPAHFSNDPTDDEIFRVHFFEEPLVPVEAIARPGENAALVYALTSFSQRTSPDDFSSINTFIKEYPDSRWRGALLANLGIVYRRTGYYSHALNAWQQAWDLMKDQIDPKAKVLADRTISELLLINAWVGRTENIESLLKEIDHRLLEGPAVERIASAREAVWMMKNNPGISFKCGPYALGKILTLSKSSSRQGKLNSLTESNKKLVEIQSTAKGFSLTELGKLAHEVGLDYQMAFRKPGAEMIFNSVVHWNLDHYSSVLTLENGQYECEDATMGTVYGQQFWLTPAALDSSASGYFLAPNGALPKGWRKVMADEGNKVFGKGNEPPDKGKHTSCDDEQSPKCKECPKTAMAQSNVHSAAVSLHIFDRPVYYTPPKGPAMTWDVYYHQRESYQPANFGYSNIGPKWTFEWLSYVQDDPNNPSANADVYLMGGGVKTFTLYNTATRSYAPELQTNNVLVRTCPTCYELRHPDGSKKIYARPDGSTIKGRKLFLTEKVDAAGNKITLSYDTNLRIVALQDAIGQVTTVKYEDPSDIYKITEVTDPFGRSASFSYDSFGRLTTITDMIGITSTFRYDAGDFINQMTTPYGTTNFYKEEGGPGFFRSLETHYPQGEKERVQYSESPPLTMGKEPAYPKSSLMKILNGNLHIRNTFFWDKKAMQEAPGDLTKARIYHWLSGSAIVGENQIIPILESIKDPLENRVWYTYQGQTTAGRANRGMSAKPSVVGRVLDDSSEQITQFTYNAIGHVTSSTDPAGRKLTYIYAPNNIDLLEVRQTTNGANELLARYTYNNQHLRLTATDASVMTTRFTYNATGQLLTITNPKNQTTTYAYNSDGYLQNITGPVAGSQVSFAYDGFGRVRTMTDPEGYTITIDYDALDRPTLITYPDNTFEQIVYSRLDAVHRKDRLGRWSHTVYDSLDRPSVIQDALGRITQLIWCSCGSLTEIVDPLKHITTFTRDLQGRIASKIYHDGKTINYKYENTTSRLKEMTDAKGQTTKYTYFIDDNRKQIDYLHASIATPSVAFSYDAKYNRIITMKDGSGTTTYGYHPVTTSPNLGASHLATVDGPLSADVIAYTYDSLGRERARSINGVVSSIVYDVLGRITSATNALGSFAYSYINQTNRPSSIILPNGQSTVFDYFNNTGDQHLRQILNRTSNGTTLSKFSYEYNDEGQITKWTKQTDTTDTAYFELVYDLADQLISATLMNQNTGNILKRYSYQYDIAGNLTGKQLDNSVTSASYNALNQVINNSAGGPMRFKGTVNEFSSVLVKNQTSLDSAIAALDSATNSFEAFVKVIPGTNIIAVAATDYSGNNNKTINNHNITVANGVNKTISFDNNGNTISENNPGLTYDWDAADRLVKITKGANITEFIYDGLSRRVAEKLNGAIIKRWIWCGTELCEERNAGGGTVTKRFFRQGEQISGTNYYFTQDHLGSVHEMTDGSGNIGTRYDYDPYGRRTKVAGNMDADFGFTGHYFHQTSGLHLAMYRAYDANLGRWLSRDPMQNAEIKEGSNLYVYVGNNSVNNTDLLGLQQCKPECEWNFKYFPPQCLDVTKPRDCETEQNNCRSRGILACGSGGVVNKAAGLFCAVLYNKVCYHQNQECEKWNREHGF